MKTYNLLICLLLQNVLWAQSLDTMRSCNRFGAWIWKIEYTGMSHAQLADKLAQLGVKRVYIKVSDGRHEADKFPELNNARTVAIYKERGIEPWAWSYNYPENEAAQASVLSRAAKTGYVGYVLDIEKEFDDNAAALRKLFVAFDQAKQRAIKQSITHKNFKLYCTTWGNPGVHRMAIGVMDKYVDAHLPQTYLEEWQEGFRDPAAVIRKVNAEYKRLGATKPIHHIAALQRGMLTVRHLNEFFAASGAESSLWRVPGHGISMKLWEVWSKINWHQHFEQICTPTYVDSAKTMVETDLETVSNKISTKYVLTEFVVFPNPFSHQLTVRCNRVLEKDFYIQISDGLGQVVYFTQMPVGQQEMVIFATNWMSGAYYLQIFNKEGYQHFELIKLTSP